MSNTKKRKLTCLVLGLGGMNGYMTVKITVTNGKTILSGCSYKRWDMQIRDYCHSAKAKISSIVVSRSQWIARGGLKWCGEDLFQKSLNDEGKGRSYKDFEFTAAKKSHLKEISDLLV